MELILTGYVDPFDNWEALTEFKNALIANRGQNIEMVICSGGGSVVEGLELSTLIKSNDGATKASIYGMAASIATVIAMSADKVLMDENARMMIHNALGGNFGTSEDLRKTANQLDDFSEQIMSFYVSQIAKNGKLVNGNIEDTKTMLAECMKEERFMSANECFEMGLIDKVINMKMPKAVSDNSQELIGQIEAKFPTFAAQYPNFKNSYQPQSQMKDDKKGIFATLVNSLASILGIKNEAQAVEEVQEQPQSQIEEPAQEAQPQIEEDMTTDQMIEALKAQGFDVSQQVEQEIEQVEETQAEAKIEEPAQEQQEAEQQENILEVMQAQFNELKTQLEETKAALADANFKASVKKAGVSSKEETTKEQKDAAKEQRTNKILAALGSPFAQELKRLNR